MKKSLPMMWIVLFISGIITATFGTYSISLKEGKEQYSQITLTVDGYALQSKSINGQEATAVSLPDATYLQKKGYPELPKVSRSLAIPMDGNVALEIVNITYEEIPARYVVPSKGTVYRTTKISEVPYTFEGYSENAFYPQENASLSEPYIIRDFRGVTVHFYPFQYNPVTKTLRVAQSITVKVQGVHSNSIKVRGAVSPEFRKIYGDRFLNFDGIESRYEPVADGDKMIIITPERLRDPLDKLVEWKNQKGIETTVHIYPDETGTGKDNIKKFIQKKYDEEKITYVLLVGDDLDMPSFTAGASDNSGKSDPTYVYLAGNDHYPDAFIGRFAASTEAGVEIMVNKTLHYEKNPSGSYYNKAMGIASDEGSPKDWQWMDDFRAEMLKYTYTKVDQVYDPGAKASTITANVNEGRGWINYMGHGLNNLWGTTMFNSNNVKQLKNDKKYPIIVSVACLNGEYDVGECFGEVWTEHSENNGAVAAYVSSISQAWVPPQHAMKEMVEGILVKDKALSLGGILYNGGMYMLDQGNDAYTMDTWILLGDPSLTPYTDTPKEISITETSMNRGTVSVTLSERIKGRVSLYDTQKQKLIVSKIVRDRNTVSLDVGNNTSNLEVFVTALNAKPVSKKLDSSPIGTVVSKKGQSIGIVRSSQGTMTIALNSSSVVKNIEMKVFDLRGVMVSHQKIINGNKNFSFSAASGAYFTVVTFVNERGKKVSLKQRFNILK